MRAFFLILVVLLSSPALACTDADPCTLGDRSYHVREPEGWDGTSALPVHIHFHGWGRQGTVPIKSPRTGGAASEAGVLFVAPDGLGRTWDFRRAGSRDTPFAEAVLADVAARYPTRGPLIVSGYSWGALMAARFACETKLEIDALLLVAGAFPRGIPCEGRPMRVSHVHGTTDTVLDFPYGPDGETTEAVAHWLDVLDCGPEDRRFEWQAVEILVQTRHEWDCGPRLVTMDVHSASHLIPRGWVARHLSEVLAGSAG
ncbi:MAG: polyhydroxybutyrate depolymerase [Pseudomonadota bacterium]